MENATGNIGVSYDDLLQAYRECRCNKRDTHNAIAFEINYEANLLALRDEINTRTYTQCINSYWGLTRHFNAYALRRDLIDAISPEWRKVVYPDKDFTKLIIKKRFKHRERIKFALRKQRRKAKRNIT